LNTSKPGGVMRDLDLFGFANWQLPPVWAAAHTYLKELARRVLVEEFHPRKV
jgi:hypothetical protein